MASVPDEWKNGVGREVIQTGGYIFMWVVGIYCCIRFMIEYEFTLKPLFLAAVFISVIEAIVQLWQFCLQRLFKGLWLLLTLVVTQPFQHLYGKVFSKHVDTRGHVSCREVLCPCSQKTPSWPTYEKVRVFCEFRGVTIFREPYEEDSDHSGQIRPWLKCLMDLLCWLLALVGAFVTIAGVVWLVYMLAYKEITNFQERHRPDAYVAAGKSMIQDLINFVRYAPTHIPLVNNNETTHWWASLVHNYTANITAHEAEIFGYAESSLKSFFNGTMQATMNIVSQTFFFFLYSVFWLVDPLAIMLGHSKSPHKPQRRDLEQTLLPNDAEQERASTRPSPTAVDDAVSPTGGHRQFQIEVHVGDTVEVPKDKTARAFEHQRGTSEVDLSEGTGVVKRIDKTGKCLIAFTPLPPRIDTYSLAWLLSFCDCFSGHEDCIWSRKSPRTRKCWVSNPGQLKEFNIKRPPAASAAETVNIIQKYFKLKTAINFFTAAAYFFLFLWLQVDLKFVLVMLAFFLGFIPELGFILQVIVSVPVVLLSPVDSKGDLHWSQAGSHLLWFSLGSFVIKSVMNNGLEVFIMKSDKVLNQGGEEVHPVLILFLLALGDEIWGCVGMLLAVPAIYLGRLLFRIAHDTIHARDD